MIEVVEQEGNFLWLQAKDKLTHNDYEQVLIPRIRVFKAAPLNHSLIESGC